MAALLPRALNFEGATAPEWIELIPAGSTVAGVDGRAWANPDPGAVVAATKAINRPLPLDREHATELLSPKGEEAPAAGWIEDVEVRNGAVWGRVTWTPRAANQVKDREYRFVSPVFTYERNPPHKIVRLVSVALTNTPNLFLTALNARQSESQDVDLAAQMRALYGMSADASHDDIIKMAKEHHAKAMAKASNSQHGDVDLVRYAPREELATAINRANELQTQLNTRTQADRDAAIETALNTAQTEGRITPASRSHYLSMCQAEGGLERFVELAKTLPVLVANQGAAPPKPPGESAAGSGLTAEQKALCQMMSWDEGEYAKSLKGA